VGAYRKMNTEAIRQIPSLIDHYLAESELAEA